jgi:hypothetical protein
MLAVLIAAVAISAVVGSVLVVRQLNQQRQITTQKSLETAFKATFGGPGFKGPNMRAHFTYEPDEPSAVPPGFHDLLCLMDRTAIAASDFSHPTGVAQFVGLTTLPYWNGPYWQGSVDAGNRPVDAWGRPIQLRFITGVTLPVQPGWQFYSLGANGVDDTQNAYPALGDDLTFPNPPYQIPAKSGGGTPCTPQAIQFDRSLYTPAEIVTITLTWTGGSQSKTTQFNGGHPDGNPPPVFSGIPKGDLLVSFVSNRRAPPSQSITLDCETIPPVAKTIIF